MKENKALKKLFESFKSLTEETEYLKGKLSIMKSEGVEDTGPLLNQLNSLEKWLTIMQVDISQIGETWPMDEVEDKVLS